MKTLGHWIHQPWAMAKLVLISVILLGFGSLGISLFGENETSVRLKQLIDQGVIVEAEVTRMTVARRSRVVDFRYTVGDHLFTGRTSDLSIRPPGFPVGSRIPVKYLPLEPAVSEFNPEGQLNRRIAGYRIAIAIASLGGLSFMVICLIGLKTRLKPTS